MECKVSSSRNNSRVKENNTFVWFKKWIHEGYTVAQLQAVSSHSSHTLQRLIHHWLANPPLPIQPGTEGKYLVFDGSFVYKRTIAIVALLDGQTGKLIACQYGIKENSQPALLLFFQSLSHQGLAPVSCTVDGNLHVVRALQTVWPTILIQRCRVHVHRQGLMWCRTYPKSIMGQKLRSLFVAMLSVNTTVQKECWLAAAARWEKRYGHTLDGVVPGWVMNDLKRARRMLLNASPYLFHHLLNPAIPSTTNRAEGFFSILKRSYKRHTGLALHRRKSFIQWFCFFFQSS